MLGAVGDAVALEPRGLAARALGEELEQSRLADTVLADEEQRVTSALRERFDGRAEEHRLVLPADERSGLSGSGGGLGTDQSPGFDRGLSALHGQVSERFQTEAGAKLSRSPRAHDDGSRLRFRLQTCGHVHRVPERHGSPIPGAD